MSQVSYLLKKAGAGGKSLIYLQFKYAGKKLVFSFGQPINSKNWNRKKQRVKSNKQTTADGEHSLNDLLKNLQEVCEVAYKNELKNGIPNPQTLKKYLTEFMQQNAGEEKQEASLFTLIDRFINNEIKFKNRNKTNSTIKTYKTLKGHLREFEWIKKMKVNFESITLDFYYKYIDYLQKRDQYEKAIRVFRPELKNKRIERLRANSIAKDIQILKVIMGEAIDLGYTNNLQYKHKKFCVTREDTDAIYLAEKEIISLYRFNLTKNKKLEQVRDLFVFGCYVGLRYSDYSTVRPENIVKMDFDNDGNEQDCIKLITQKTKEEVIIPCNPIVLEIFEKYEHNPNRLPKTISNQKFNDYLKELCRLAGMIEKGRLATDPSRELCDCISSHTARRSFATNYYLDGFKTIDLMKVTGHKTERAFLKYIRITKEEVAKRMNEHNKQKRSRVALSIAS